MSQEEDLASEDLISSFTSYQNETVEDDESFAVGVRYNISNDKKLVEIKHIANQDQFKQKLLEIKGLKEHKREPKQLTEEDITKTIYANTERFRNYRGIREDGKGQLVGNRLTNRAIGRIQGDASGLYSSMNTSGDEMNYSAGFNSSMQHGSVVETDGMLEVCPIRSVKIANVDPLLRMTQFNAENSVLTKTLKRPKPNYVKRAAEEKHRIDFDLLLQLPLDLADEKAKEKRREVIAREEKLLEGLQHKELKRLLREFDIEQGKPVYSSGTRRKKEAQGKSPLLEVQSPHFPSQGGKLINFYGDLSTMSRRLVSMDWKDEKGQQIVQQYPHYSQPKNDLSLNISELYLSFILGRYPPLKVQDKIRDTFSHQSGNVTSNMPLGAIDEGDEMNLSEVSISEVQTIEQFPEDNHYSFVRDIETPINEMLERTNALRSENLEDLIEQMTPSHSKKSINPGILGDGESMLQHSHVPSQRPLSPGVFAYELKRAYTRDGEKGSPGRRQALQYNSEFLEQMESMHAENEEQRLKVLQEKQRRKHQDSNSQIETLSQQQTIVSNPYGTSGTTEQESYRPGQIATVEHSRQVSQTEQQSPFNSLEKVPPKRGEKKGAVTFDESALQLELDGHEEEKLLPYIEKSEDLVQELKELHPGDIEGGSVVYNILKEQYSARLKESVVAIIGVLQQIGEFSAIGMQYVVRIAQVGCYVIDEKVKGELYTRVVKEYRKNVEIKNRELKRMVTEKRRQRAALARTLRKAGSPSGRKLNQMRKTNSEFGLQINHIIRNQSELSSLGSKRMSASPTRYSSRTSASSSGKKNSRGGKYQGAIDSASKVKIRKKEESRVPLRSKSSNLFSKTDLTEEVNVTPQLGSKEESKKTTPRSTPKSRSITPFEPQKKVPKSHKVQKAREKENVQKNIKKAKIERTKAYAAGVKEKQIKMKEKKPKSILDDKIVTVQKAKADTTPERKKKVIVSYKGGRGGTNPSRPVVVKKQQKNVRVEGGDSDGNEGWLGADLDF